MTYKEEGEGIARTVQVHGGVVVKAESWLVLTIVAVPLQVGGGLRQNLKSCERRLMSEVDEGVGGELTLDDDWHRFTVPVCLSSLFHLLHLRWIVDKLPVEGARVVLSSELVPALCYKQV